VPRQVQTVAASANGALANQRLGVHPDTHGRQLKRPLQHRTPYENVAVQPLPAVPGWGGPVVVIRGPAVVDAAVGQSPADPHQEDRLVLAAGQVLTLARSQVRVLAAQILAVDEGDPVRQQRRHAEPAAHGSFRAAHGGEDARHRVLQGRQGAVFTADGQFPVPLVHVDRMDGAGQVALVGPQGVHVAIDPVARRYAIPEQGVSLPFGQRLHHLEMPVAKLGRPEPHRGFHAVQVVLQSGVPVHEQGTGDAGQPQRPRQRPLKMILDEEDSLFQFHQFGSGCKE